MCYLKGQTELLNTKYETPKNITKVISPKQKLKKKVLKQEFFDAVLKKILLPNKFAHFSDWPNINVRLIDN